MILIWGSNFSVIKFALRDFPELSFNALRLALASLLFLVALAVVRTRARRDAEPPPPLATSEWRLLLLLGLLGTTLYQWFFLAGVARTSVANAALIFGCTPVAVAIMATVAGHDRLTTARWLGAALSFTGIYAIVGHRAAISTATLAGDALVLAGMLCWSLYSVLAQPLLTRHSPLVVSAWAMVSGTIVYLLFAAVPLWRTDWAAISLTSWLLMAASSLLALFFAYIIWYTGVQRLGSARTAVYSNLTPIVAMTVGALWLGEQISRNQLLGAALILSGIAITRLRPAGAAGEIHRSKLK